MSIRPIDMQVLLPKVQEASRIQQLQNDIDQNQQQQFAQQLEKQTQAAQHQVQQTPKAEGGRVGSDKGKQSHEQDKQHKHNDQTESKPTENEELKDPQKGHFVDIQA